MNYFTIGEFSKIIGIPVKTLRYYEQLGILKPERDESNHYRRYTDLDARRVMYCRYYRSLGFSLDEICRLFEESDLNDVRHSAMAQSAALQEEIDQLTARREMLDYYTNQIPLEQNAQKQCWIQKTEAEYYLLPKTHNDDLVRAEEKEELTKRLLDMMPKGSMTVHIAKETLLDRKAAFCYEWGCGILKKWVTDPQMADQLELYGGEYRTDTEAVTMLRHSEDGLCRQDLDPLLSYVKEQGYELSGDVMGMLMFPEFTPDMVHYIKIFAPVRRRQ